jgi:predicted RNA-binding protein with EMAP domain
MNKGYQNYDQYFELKRTYSSAGFRGIDRQDPLILALEIIKLIQSGILKVPGF